MDLHEFVIRPAQEGDAADLARLAQTLGYGCSDELMAARWRKAAGDDRMQVLVVEGGRRVVGWIAFSGRTSMLSDGQAEIDALIVDPQARGRGLGRALVEAAADWAARIGCNALRVRSNVVRDPARAFYEKLGFTVSKTQSVFDRRLPPSRRKSPP